MRISIATRVTAACVLMLALSVSLVGTGISVGGQVQAANERIDHLTHLLRRQDVEDKAQRRLRLALGDATREAEQRNTVSDARWAELSAQLRVFAGMSRATMDEAGTVSPPICGRRFAKRGWRPWPLCRRAIT